MISVSFLTSLQEGILLHHLQSPEQPDYVVQLSADVRDLDLDRWRSAWNFVVARHPMLRTAIAWKTQLRPLQLTVSDVEMPWSILDWSKHPPDVQTKDFEALLRVDRDTLFKLTHPPLMRGILIILSPGRWRFLWTYHHLILDAWSSSLILSEVTAAYLNEVVPVTSDEGIPFKRYVDYLTGLDLTEAEGYWRRTLTGAVVTPIWHGHGEVGSTTSMLDEASSGRLTTFCRSQGVTLATLVQAAWALVIARWNGTLETIVGVTVSDRPSEIDGVERMIGPCIATLPVRLKIPLQQRVREHLAAVQAAAVDMREHSHAPLSRILGWVGADAASALFDTLIVFENLPSELSALTGDSNAPFSNLRSEWYTHYPLTVMVVPGSRLTVQMRAAGDQALLDKLADALLKGIQALARDPDRFVEQALGEVPAPELSPIAVGSLKPDYLTTPAPVLIMQACTAFAASPAIVTATETVSYDELGARIHRLSLALAAHGVQPGMRVVVRLARTSWLPAALIGIQMVGAAYVALDPGLPPERFTKLMVRAGSDWLLVDRSDGFPTPVGMKVLVLDELAEAAAVPLPAVSPTATAYIIFTSGSTGQPNAVVIRHAALSNLLRAIAVVPGLAAGDRVLATTTIGFDIAVVELLAPLCVGATVLLYDQPVSTNPQEVIQFITATAPDVIQATPSLWELLFAHGWTGRPSLRAWSGGERLSQDLAWRLKAHAREVWNLYGPTETTIWSTAAQITEVKSPVVIGRPLANTSIVLLDDTGRRVSIGAIGEICIGGAGLADGYDGDPYLASQRFTFWHSDSGVQRLYHTGDFGRFLTDGSLLYLGRCDRQLKIRGVRVEPEEIEAMLRQHPSVAAAAVIPFRSPLDGDRMELAGFVQIQLGMPAPDFRDIWKALSQRLPTYMASLRLKVLDRLPLSPNGKVDQRQLVVMAEAEELGAVPTTAGGVPILELVLQILRHVLNQPDLGSADDFLAAGGDSLLAMRVVARINHVCGVDLRPSIVVERRCAAALAAVVAEYLASGIIGLSLRNVAKRCNGPAPLTDSQRQLWFLGVDQVGLAPYHLVAAIAIDWHVDADALQRAINELINRHDILRTGFRQETSGVMQEAVSVFNAPLSIAKVEPGETLEKAVERLAIESAAQPFDRTHPPLLRFSLVQSESSQFAILLAIDHIIADAWSIRLMFSELVETYEREGNHKVVKGLTQPLQFQDFACWRAETASPEQMVSDLNYWRRKLADLSHSGLPLDKPRPAQRTFMCDNVFLILALDDTQRVLDLARRNSTSLFSLLLSAYRVVLLRTMGEARAGIGTMLAGRDHPDLESMLGFLARTVVLHNPITAEMNFAEILLRERETLLDAWRHQSVAFDEIVSDQRRRNLSNGVNPMFQTMFVTYAKGMPDSRRTMVGVQLLKIAPRFVEFDLVVRCYENEESLEFCFSYDTAIFENATIVRMVKNYKLLLSLVTQYPDLPVGRLPLGGSETDELVDAFLNTEGRGQ
ncbi:MAG: amino acid adenylation domain-containing protein [Myxacorys chilensis ATA2-1-KO14]|jgi:amino acid adenylation domain-containing protein|nr:amino acid adenylation domain-containing protein [Myxacorys chilensis ATA2-1-KO14]